MTDQSLPPDTRARIEELFAGVTPATLRQASRELERLVASLPSGMERRKYEAAIDCLPDMVKHLDARGDD